MDLMRNESISEALIAENLFTLIMAVIIVIIIIIIIIAMLSSSMHIGREEGINQLCIQDMTTVISNFRWKVTLPRCRSLYKELFSWMQLMRRTHQG